MRDQLAPGFLIATPHLADPNFKQTVVLLFDHDDNGAVGLVINRPVDIQLRRVVRELGIEADRVPDVPVYYGGPVQMDVGWLIHGVGYDDVSTRPVADDVLISTSRDALTAVAGNEGPDEFQLCLGYAGWGQGQLEHEVAEGAWLTLPFDRSLVFSVPAGERWREAYRRLGIDPSMFSPVMGSA